MEIGTLLEVNNIVYNNKIYTKCIVTYWDSIIVTRRMVNYGEAQIEQDMSITVYLCEVKEGDKDVLGKVVRVIPSEILSITAPAT